MKIELSKDIQINKIEFVGEVDFFDEKSPYIKLLKNIETKDELIEKLKYRNMPDAAIKNIVVKLEGLKVLKNGYLENIEKGFPEKEYGKYTLEIFKNDTPLPFKNKNKQIKRDKAVLGYGKDNNIKPDENYIKIVQDKTNKDFRINTIENDKANEQALGDSKLIIRYINQKWHYLLENKSYKMEDINFKNLFEDWDEEYNALMMNFSNIKKDDKYIKSFKMSFPKDIELDNYGNLKGEFQDVDIIPKTQYDAKEWFIYLLKDEIEQLNKYISKSELKELWEDMKERNPVFKKFELEFDFERILKEFGKSSKYYWLLQASIDLYPFDIDILAKDRIVIENMDDFNNNFNFDIKKLVIIDRYLNTIRHFSILEDILTKLDKPSLYIFSMENYRDEAQEIEHIIKQYDICRIIKNKNEIEHDRYWIINDNLFYKTGKSLDGIHKTSFDLYEKETIERIAPGVIKLLEEIK